MEIFFILVEPAVPENVGASARALKTMSFNNLRLVNPCDYLSAEARKLAHGAGDILTSATVFSSMGKATGDLDFVIGTSAKGRRVKHDYYPVDQLPDLIARKGNFIRRIGIVFGREESGLSNEEIHLCDIISYIPMAGRYPSLNLSHAVMIVAYELSAINIGKQKNLVIMPANLTLKAARMQIEEILSSVGVTNNKTLYNRIIERINIVGEDDLHLLYSICKHFSAGKEKKQKG
jgi:tRNA/rRNA methyltransferase